MKKYNMNKSVALIAILGGNMAVTILSYWRKFRRSREARSIPSQDDVKVLPRRGGAPYARPSYAIIAR